MPRPAGWVDSRRPLLWAGVPLCGLLGWVLYWGIIAIGRGDLVTAGVICGCWLFPATTYLALLFAAFGRVDPRVSYDGTGTTLRPDRRFSILLLSGLSALIPAGLLFVIFVPRGRIGIPMSDGMRVFSPVLVGLAVLVAAVGLLATWRRGGLGYVKLLPVGIAIASIATTKVIAWEAITDITDRGAPKARNPIVLCRSDAGPESLTGADLYVPHGNALYWMIRHYWRLPENRSELTDGRAVERLNSGTFEG